MNTIPVRVPDLQAGDKFERHGRTWTVRYVALCGSIDSRAVEAKEGVVYAPCALKLDVERAAQCGTG